MASFAAILIADGEGKPFTAAMEAVPDWRVAAVISPAQAFAAVARRRFALMLLDEKAGGRACAPDIAASVRRRGGTGSDIPILVLNDGGPIHGGEAPAFADGVIPRDGGPDRIGAALAPWRPGDESPAIDRLAELFGAARIGMLLRGLRDQLADSLLAAGDDPDCRHVAHRTAGICGTLGFLAAARAWQAVSEGDAAALPQARVATRRALHAITGDILPRMTGFHA